MAGLVACMWKSVAIAWGCAEIALFSCTGLREQPETCAVSARTARSPAQWGQDTGQRASRVILRRSSLYARTGRREYTYRHFKTPFG